MDSMSYDPIEESNLDVMCYELCGASGGTATKTKSGKVSADEDLSVTQDCNIVDDVVGAHAERIEGRIDRSVTVDS